MISHSPHKLLLANHFVLCLCSQSVTNFKPSLFMQMQSQHSPLVDVYNMAKAIEWLYYSIQYEPEERNRKTKNTE